MPMVPILVGIFVPTDGAQELSSRLVCHAGII